MAATRYRHATCISFGTDGEADYAEFDVEVSFTVAWGSPETGAGYMADPYAYDPGSPDEVEDLRVELIDGQPRAAWTYPSTFEAMILDELDREPHLADMLAEARNAEAAWAEVA